MGFLRKICHFFGYTLPAIVKPLTAHLLRLSPTSSQCTFPVILVVSIFRAIFNDPSPVSMLEQQESSTKDPGVYGPLWVVLDEFHISSSTNLQNRVIEAIASLGDGTEPKLDPVQLLSVRGEWVGYRSGAGLKEPQPQLTAKAKYHGMMQETKRKITILFAHGGQFFMRNPASRRSITAELAKLSSGRCFTVQFRLSPQYPFPAALLDFMVAYLSLQYPAPNSLHDAVPASEICWAGDSSGANVCLAVLQTILELQRQSLDGKARILWQGVERVLEPPAAVTLHSAFLDLARSLPSETANLPFDLLPNPDYPPFPDSQYVPSTIWPTTPPRNSVYASDSMILHPLVSPVIATDWHNCPTRMWFSVGQECLADASFVVAHRAMAQGVVVSVEQYAGMPHDFTLLFPKSISGEFCLSRWAQFMCEAVDHPRTPAKSGFKTIDLSGKEWDVEPKQLVSAISLEFIKAGMEAQVRGWNSG